MTVNELINYLQKQDANKTVSMFVNWENDQLEITDIASTTECILLGNDIPPEKHDMDYKYEDG